MENGSGMGTSDDGSWDFARADVLRLTTAGNVDDGKSTLVGRLLIAHTVVYKDQWRPLPNESEIGEAASTWRCSLMVFSRARAYITIYVAYAIRHTRRRFLVADSPGTFSTPNM